MAKRKRLIPGMPAAGYEPDPAETGTASLRPGPLANPLGLAPRAEAPIARVAGEAARQAALEEVTGAMTRARAEGRLILSLRLEEVDPGHLVRDRIAVDAEELDHLMASIRDHGQRMPLEVADLGEGREGPRYGLISGWRRLEALRRLHEATGEARFGTVLALLRRPADASQAYVAMIEENELRQGLSYYERARIAARAVDLGVFDSEKQALQRLFSAASRARRSKIGSFLTLYRRMDPVLRFPVAIPERLGLALAKALEERPEAVSALLAELAADPAPDAEAEQGRLGRFIAGKEKAGRAGKAPSDRGADMMGQEVRPGLFLKASGRAGRHVLTLSGPALDSAFRARLEDWLASGA